MYFLLGILLDSTKLCPLSLWGGRNLASISLDWQILETQSKQILETQSATNIWTLIHTNTQTIPHGHIQSSKLNSTMCFVCLILTSQNISRGAVIFVESQNISQLMDEKLHRKGSFDGFSPEADWALTHLQTFLSKQCKREPRWCKIFIWLKLLGSFSQFFVVVIIQFRWLKLFSKYLFNLFCTINFAGCVGVFAMQS